MSNRELVTFTKLPNKDLRIALIPECREEIEEIAEQYGVQTDACFYELIEYQLCNGWDNVSAEDIGALWGGEFILCDNDVRNDRTNEIESIQAVWAYGGYQIRSEASALLDKGYIDLTCFDEWVDRDGNDIEKDTTTT